jgi:hypothetical protein
MTPPLWRRALAELCGTAFLVAVVVGSGALSGDDPAEDASNVDGVLGTKETTALLRGIPQDGLTLGAPSAPVTIVEFVDVKCPFCKDYALTDGEQVIRDLVRPGKAKIELRVLANLGESSVTGRTAIHDVAARDQAWTLSELLYFNQRSEAEEWVTPDLLGRIGRTAPELRGIPLSTTPTAASRRLDTETDRLRIRIGSDGKTPTIYVRPSDRTDAGAFREVDLRGTGSKAAKVAGAVADLTR